MPRPIIATLEKTTVRISVSGPTPNYLLSSAESERRLRQKRSAKYLAAMTRLDTGGHHANETLIRELLDVIREELPEITIEQLPIGILAKCYLEPPHDVHCLDVDGAIVQHYKAHEALPPLLERARGLSLHGGYAFIEVYRDCLRAVKNDGTISVVKED